MRSSVCAIALRSWPAAGRRALAPLLRDVPGLADAGAAVDRLELVAPDPAADSLPSEIGGRVCQAMRRSSSNSMTSLTVEYGTPIFMDIPNVRAEVRAAGTGRPCASRTEPEPSMSRCLAGSASSAKIARAAPGSPARRRLRYGSQPWSQGTVRVWNRWAPGPHRLPARARGAPGTRSRRSARPPTSSVSRPRRARGPGRGRPARSCRASATPRPGSSPRRSPGKVPSYLERLELDAVEADDRGGRAGRRGAGLAARRPAHALGLVRRRLTGRAHGAHRGRARPRVPGDDRPLPPAHDRARA